MKRLPKVLIPVAFIVVAGAVAGWYFSTATADSSDELTLYGNVEIRDARLAFKEQDRITNILVEEGDRVTEGQLLARLDTNRLQAQINEAQSSMDAQAAVVKRLEEGTRKEEIAEARAKVKASDARYQNELQRFQRIKQTTAAKATSQQNLDDARASLDVATAQLAADQQALELALAGPRKETIVEAKAQLKALQDGLALLKIRYGDLWLKAPEAGVVRSRLLEPGEMAGPDTPVLSLSLTNPKWVRAYIPEPELGRIRQGMKAEVISDSYPTQPFSGWIGFISPVAEFTPRNVETTDLRTKLVYEVRVFVKDPQDRLRLGAPVTVTVEEGGKGPA